MTSVVTDTMQDASLFSVDADGIYLNTKAIEAVGIEEDTIKKGLMRYRKAESVLWEHKKVGNRIWIRLDTLPSNTKQRIHFFYNDVAKVAAESSLKSGAIGRIEQNDVSEFMALKVKKDGTGYTIQEASDLAHACGWLRLLHAYVSEKRYDKPMQVSNTATIKGKTAFMRWCASVIYALDLYGFRISNGIRLNDKVEQWISVGKQCLIHKQFGNENRVILQPSHIDFIIVHYAKNKKSIPQLVRLLEIEFSIKVTRQAVMLHLEKPENKQKWQPMREGMLIAERRSRSLLTLAKPKFADAIWQLDASPIALFANDGDGVKKSKYTTVFIRDTYSGKCVGLAFGITETSELVKSALRHAVANTGYLPYSMRYDGGAANMSKEVQEVMSLLATYHFKTAPYRPTGKASIEQYVNQVENVLRGFDNFAGGNITRRGTEKSFNPDVVKRMQKEGRMPTSSQTIVQVWAAVEILNNTVGSDGQTPNVIYEKCDDVNRRKATIEIVSAAFWKHRTRSIRYEMGGIKMQVGELTLQYWVGSPMVEDYEFKRKNEGKSFEVRYNPDDLSMIALYNKDGSYIDKAVLKHEYSLLPDFRADGEGEAFGIMQTQNKRFIEEGVREYKEAEQRLKNQDLPTEFDFLELNKAELGRVESAQIESLLAVGRNVTDRKAKKTPNAPPSVDEQTQVSDSEEIDFYDFFSNKT